MRLLEFEAKRILAGNGIPVPDGVVVNQAEVLTRDRPCMVKAQVEAGGRGKVGAVVACEGLSSAREATARLLLEKVHGLRVEKVLVEERIEVASECYAAATYDSGNRTPVVAFGLSGGVDVERTSSERQGAVVVRPFSVRHRLEPYQAREVVCQAGLSGRGMLRAAGILHRLASLLLDLDALTVEINPLGLCADGQVVALDARIELEDEALARHRDLPERYGIEPRLSSTAGRPPTAFEQRAAQIDTLDHRGVAGRVIEFDGDMALLIGGGGASLTAFDAIRRHGGRPANYCEIGGNPTVRKVRELTQLLLSRDGVRKIAVIMNVVSNTRVDLVARGVIGAILSLDRVPADTVSVFRIPGSWEDEGLEILRHYGIEPCDRTVTIDEAARRAVGSGT